MFIMLTYNDLLFWNDLQSMLFLISQMVNISRYNSYKPSSLVSSYIVRVEKRPKTQQLRVAGLCYSVLPLEVKEERGYTFYVLVLLNVMLRKECPIEIKKKKKKVFLI